MKITSLGHYSATSLFGMIWNEIAFENSLSHLIYYIMMLLFAKVYKGQVQIIDQNLAE